MHLGEACGSGAVAGVQSAVKDGADVNATNLKMNGKVGGKMPAAYIAAFKGHADVLTALFEVKGFNPDAGNAGNGMTPIYVAAMKGHADCVAVLAGGGADPNIAAKSTTTPAMVCADNGHADCLQELAKAKVKLDVNAKNKKGMTALDKALDGNENEECATVLRSLGGKRAADM